jgi:hypothetical protein
MEAHDRGHFLKVVRGVEGWALYMNQNQSFHGKINILGHVL